MSTLSHDFNSNIEKVKKKREAPFSLRLTFEERAALEEAANGIPLGAYIKAVLFGDDLEKVRRRNTNPVADHAALGQVLGKLGASRLSSNLNQLAHAANIGTLPLTPDVEDDLRDACADVAAMRKELLSALGQTAEREP